MTCQYVDNLNQNKNIRCGGSSFGDFGDFGDSGPLFGEGGGALRVSVDSDCSFLFS